MSLSTNGLKNSFLIADCEEKLHSLLPYCLQCRFVTEKSGHSQAKCTQNVDRWSDNRFSALEQPFSFPVLVTPCSARFVCLSLLTHLIQISSLLELSSVHRLCSNLHSPYKVCIAPYSLSRGYLLKFTSLRKFIHGFVLCNIFTHRQV